MTAALKTLLLVSPVFSQRWSEGLHGVARDGVATSFPQIIGLSSSYNDTLFHELGRLTAIEARGLNNKLNGGRYQGLTLWAPNVNIFRDPVRHAHYNVNFIVSCIDSIRHCLFRDGEGGRKHLVIKPFVNFPVLISLFLHCGCL